MRLPWLWSEPLTKETWIIFCDDFEVRVTFNTIKCKKIDKPTKRFFIATVSYTCVSLALLNGLEAASGMTFGSDGNLYISNNARFAGKEQVIRVHIPHQANSAYES